MSLYSVLSAVVTLLVLYIIYKYVVAPMFGIVGDISNVMPWNFGDAQLGQKCTLNVDCAGHRDLTPGAPMCCKGKCATSVHTKGLLSNKMNCP